MRSPGSNNTCIRSWWRSLCPHKNRYQRVTYTTHTPLRGSLKNSCCHLSFVSIRKPLSFQRQSLLRLFFMQWAIHLFYLPSFKICELLIFPFYTYWNIPIFMVKSKSVHFFSPLVMGLFEFLNVGCSCHISLAAGTISPSLSFYRDEEKDCYSSQFYAILFS